MKRIIAISDIHGCNDELRELIKLVKYQKNEDQLVLLGDYIDKGEKSKETIQHVMKLVGDGAVALGGNHEDYFIKWLKKKKEDEIYMFQGGKETIESFCKEFEQNDYSEKSRKYILEHYEKEIKFIKKLPNYYETEKYIFVHAGVNPRIKDWRESNKHFFRAVRKEFWNHSKVNDIKKTIIIGHTPTFHFWEHEKWSNDPFHFKDKNIIAIDGGCSSGGQLNALIIENLNVYSKNIKKYKK